MKLTIANRHLTNDQTIDALIETRLLALADQVRIDDAIIRVERRPESRPPYRIEMHLAVPGPDLRTEHFAYTPTQAFTQAMADIEQKLRQRTQARQLRQRSDRTHTAGARLARGSQAHSR